MSRKVSFSQYGWAYTSGLSKCGLHRQTGRSAMGPHGASCTSMRFSPKKVGLGSTTSLFSTKLSTNGRAEEEDDAFTGSYHAKLTAIVRHIATASRRQLGTSACDQVTTPRSAKPSCQSRQPRPRRCLQGSAHAPQLQGSSLQQYIARSPLARLLRSVLRRELRGQLWLRVAHSLLRGGAPLCVSTVPSEQAPLAHNEKSLAAAEAMLHWMLDR